MIFPAAILPRWFRVLIAGTAAGVLAPQLATAAPFRGLPHTRFYSFDEIGGVSSGVQLSFDPFGRLAAVQNGTYLVLNDETWLNRVEPDHRDILIRHLARDAAGVTYFSTAGNWGMLEATPSGLLRPVSLRPPDSPRWMDSIDFNRIVSDDDGTCFVGPQGVAFRFRRDGHTLFLATPRVLEAFRLSGRIYLSLYDSGVHALNRRAGALALDEHGAFAGFSLGHIGCLDDETAVFSTMTDQLMLYRKGTIAPLFPPRGPKPGGHVTAIEPLSNGSFAIAIVDAGLYLVSQDGEILHHWASTEYQHVTALAASEPGVIWAATENGILKILYGVQVTRVGQPLGLPIGWPQLAKWDDRMIVASNGGLYESLPGDPGEPTRFQVLPDQPADSGWGLAVWQDWLLVGTTHGVFGRRPREAFAPLLRNLDVDRLVMTDAGICFAVGTNEIAALRQDADGWHECAPRVPGVGYPSLTHASAGSAWLEIGPNLAARLSLEGGRIRVRTFDSFPWTGQRWVHVSIIGSTVVLSGPEGGRIFFDETTAKVVEHPAFEAVLDQCRSEWPARIVATGHGGYWISHSHGISFLQMDAAGNTGRLTPVRAIDEYIPRMQALADGLLAASTGRTLFLLDGHEPLVDPPRFQPTVVARRDIRTGTEELSSQPWTDGLELPFDRNSFSLRLFTGSYAGRRTPHYEVQINGAAWNRQDGSTLNLANLPEGPYRVRLRLTDAHGPIGRETRLVFSVAPPWFRTWEAYAAFALLAVGTILAAVRLTSRHARRKRLALEQLVNERTEQLRQTMDQLAHESRTTATLAERNRLAGEIHDSLEQGFSALMLQLETTAGLADCPARVGAGLEMARSMIAFSRAEVRNAIWDLQSPRLDAEGLEGAIRHLVIQTTPPAIEAVVEILGDHRPVGSKVEHHLLRITQEAVANAVKHGQPNRIEVRLEFGDTGIHLVIVDDGRGFDPATVARMASGRFGLGCLRSRASKLGAALEIVSRPGAGTRIGVSVPYAAS